jgi:hypothetical protein
MNNHIARGPVGERRLVGGVELRHAEGSCRRGRGPRQLSTTGLPAASTAAWILVASPPRQRPLCRGRLGWVFACGPPFRRLLRAGARGSTRGRPFEDLGQTLQTSARRLRPRAQSFASDESVVASRRTITPLGISTHVEPVLAAN